MPGHALEERALAGAVAADDAEELPVRDLEGDAPEDVQLVVLAAPEGVEGALLERLDLVLRDAEGLLEPLHLDSRVDGGSLWLGGRA